MPDVCCLPGCSNKLPQHHLFKVPNKKFLKIGSEKYIWAENMEKIVKSFRGDNYINVLYHKDKVKICEIHFKPQEIYKSKFC